MKDNDKTAWLMVSMIALGFGACWLWTYLDTDGYTVAVKAPSKSLIQIACQKDGVTVATAQIQLERVK